MTTAPHPRRVIERALAKSTADGCVVVVDHTANANLRWANNTLTTNGVMHDIRLTVAAMVDGATGTASGVVSRTAVSSDQVDAVVGAAEDAARAADPAEDARPLVSGDADPAWDDEPADTGIDVFRDFSPRLGEAFGRAREQSRLLYGFVEHDVTTTYLATSAGLRRRHVQPTGFVTATAKSADGSRSAWVGRATRDFSDVDAQRLDEDLTRRLAWAERTVALPADRYDTVLPPDAVADLLIYLYWTAGALDAHEGRTVFSRPGGGTKVGESLTSWPVTLRSDPREPGLECGPFVVARSSGAESSVFDNGLDLTRTDWVQNGQLAALLATRHAADVTGLAATPPVGNLVLEVDDAGSSVDEVVADVEHGLLLTCLWYIREVDPQTLLLTGLTRDGVYLVERGEVTGAVNNFRFNESPVHLLDRFTAASATVPAFSREWGDYFPRTAMPALRIPDFNMSSVSQAS